MSAFLIKATISLILILFTCLGLCIFLTLKYKELSEEIENLKRELSRRRANSENKPGSYYGETAQQAKSGDCKQSASTQPIQESPSASAAFLRLSPKEESQKIRQAIAPSQQIQGERAHSTNFQKEDVCQTASKSAEDVACANRKAQEPQYASEKVYSLERNIGSKLFVWLGGLAIAFAGFFLIKYSIERGLFTPQMRVIAGALFAIVTCLAGVLSKRFLKNLKIASILIGAGLSIAYADAFAAAEIYKLIPKLAAIPIMAGISVAMLLLSKSYDKSLSLLAVIGIFLAPLIVSTSNPNSPITLAYLAIASVFFMREFKRQKLALAPILCAAFNIFWVKCIIYN